MKKVEIYTDGACSYNPGPGGWASILIFKGREKEISGYDDNTTNNRMELTAVIKGLDTLKEPCMVNLYTDSAYVSNAFLKNWINLWKENDWKGTDKKEIKNIDLWQQLLKLTSTHKVVFIKVKGHSDNEYNNRCDKLATDEIAKNKKT